MERFEYIYHPDHDDPNPYAQSPTIESSDPIFNSFLHRIPQYSHLSEMEEELLSQICSKYGVTPEDVKMDYMVNHNDETPLHYLNRVLTDPEMNEFDVNIRYIEKDHVYEGKFQLNIEITKIPQNASIMTMRILRKTLLNYLDEILGHLIQGSV